jgi:hypothetical protein
LLEVSRYLHLNPVRGMVLGQGTPMERRERLREYRWSSYRGYAGLEKRKSFLDSEPIQEVFQTYTGRRWKAWEYRRWMEEGLIGEMEDPFEAVKWQQVVSTFNPILKGSSNAAFATIWHGSARLRRAGVTPD